MTRDADPVELLLIAALALAWACLTVARLLLVPALAALLVLAGWRPAPVASEPAAPQPPAIEAPPLAALTVAQLRRLGRAAGLPRALTRRGRRADLLAALQALPA